ncbi:MAG: class I SAM-dependent methyltransferase [bacterium]|nr:class I SAM-dependent methyltransferase [bacterium]
MNDPFGHALMDYFHGKETEYLIRRDDGYIDYENPGFYFQVYEDEKPALKFANGLILDVGCGAGRHSIWLQKLGYEVIGIDKALLACKLSKQRGVKWVVNANSLALPFKPNKFDTFLLMGNNFGIGGTIDGTIKMLQELWKIANNNALIIASCVDPEKTDNPYHLEYHRRNIKRGLPKGQVKIRVEYNGIIGNWFNLLLLTSQELEQLASQGGWEVKHIFKEELPQYFVILQRESSI